ncbi:MAG: hypothetical protein E7354_03365 [Clostridiales bacterium]|nr:hypothetical protein [Clostridiales bacterium]
MNKYMQEFEKYKEIKDIKDIIDEALKLDELYNAKKYNEMLNHINNLTNKYIVETMVWNSVNKTMPQTIEQQYVNAHTFLKAQGFKILIEKRKK